MSSFFKDSTEVGRDEFLESGGSFSISELSEFALGPEVSGARPLLLVDVNEKVRFLPLKLQSALNRKYSSDKDFKYISRTLFSAFTIYRECVNKDLNAPLTLVDGAFEWPEPSDFGWDAFDSVNFVGFALGAYGDFSRPTVYTTKGSVRTSQDVLTGEITIENLSAIVAHPDQHLKLKVAKLMDVRFIDSQAWQSTTLQVYATGLSRVITDINAGTLREREAIEFLDDLLHRKNLVGRRPVCRYSKLGESLSSNNLFYFG